MTPEPSVVITHDFMETYGGAERVTEEFARVFPDAPIVALLGRRSVACRMGVEQRFRSVLPRRERLFRGYRGLTPLLPAVADRVRLPEADVLLSSSYGFAHRMPPPKGAVHVSYCHSPLRFAWSMTDAYGRHLARGRLAEAAFRAFAAAMRESDRRSVRRVDSFLTQSSFTAEQIRSFYGRPAEVIGAPVDCSKFTPSQDPPGDWFLLSGRLVEPYKRSALAIEAFRRAGLKLIVAGDGPALPELKRSAPPNVEFVGQLEDDELIGLMQRCAAAVFPSRDDFGLIPIEVNACGRPVIAFAGGGALHTVQDGETGTFFSDASPDGLAGAVKAFDPSAFDPRRVRAHALNWDSERFRERVRSAVAAQLSRRDAAFSGADERQIAAVGATNGSLVA